MIVLLLVLLAAFAAACAFGLDKIARGRLYKSGTGWCFWRWTDVESEYILRLHVIKSPWFAVCLHWIRKADREPWLHDHPVSFLSLVLRGSYAEIRRTGEDKPRLEVHRWWNVIRASFYDSHRIIFTRKNTLTLCFMGPKTREWGFHFPMGHDAAVADSWLGWKRYYALLKEGVDVRSADFGGPCGYEHELYAPFEAVAKERYTTETIAKIIGVPSTGRAVDEDTRAIDGEPADDFDAEEITTEMDRV